MISLLKISYFALHPQMRKAAWIVNLSNATYHHPFLMPETKITVDCNDSDSHARDFSDAIIKSEMFNINMRMSGMMKQDATYPKKIYTVIFNDIRQLFSYVKTQDEQMILILLAKLVRNPYPGPIVNLWLDREQDTVYEKVEKKFFEDANNTKNFLKKLDIIPDPQQRARFDNVAPGLIALQIFDVEGPDGKVFTTPNLLKCARYIPRMPEIEYESECLLCNIF